MVEIKAGETYLNTREDRVKVLAVVEGFDGERYVVSQREGSGPLAVHLTWAQCNWQSPRPNLKPGLVKSTTKYGSGVLWVMFLFEGEWRFVDVEHAYDTDDLSESMRWTYEQLTAKGYTNFRNVVTP